MIFLQLPELVDLDVQLRGLQDRMGSIRGRVTEAMVSRMVHISALQSKMREIHSKLAVLKESITAQVGVESV
jgi:hypothetical protein